MTVGRRFGRRSDWRILCFKSFFDFNGDALKLSAILQRFRFFLSRLRTFPTSLGYHWKFPGRASLSANSFFRYIDSRISILNQFTNWHINYFQLINSKMTRVALWQIKTETPEAWGANSHFPLRCPPHLGANGQLFQVLNCPRLEWRDQIKDQDFKVGILNED